MRVGVLASGEGTNLQALIDTVHGRAVQLIAVASDRADAPALARASAAGIATSAFPKDAHPSRSDRDAALADWLESRGVELVVLAGYMSLLDATFVARFDGRIINVHPSLLPAFPGMRAIDQALEHGVKVTGVTVHLVDAGVDTGPILLQRAVDIGDAKTPEALHRLLRPIEHELLCAAVAGLAAGSAF